MIKFRPNQTTLTASLHHGRLTGIPNSMGSANIVIYSNGHTFADGVFTPEELIEIAEQATLFKQGHKDAEGGPMLPEQEYLAWQVTDGDFGKPRLITWHDGDEQLPGTVYTKVQKPRTQKP